MEFVFALVGAIAAVVLPVYVQRKDHPRRELRYGIVPADGSLSDPSIGGTLWRVRVWSTGRAAIPSALFDAGSSVVFTFTVPIAVLLKSSPNPAGGRDVFQVASSTELRIAPQLLREDFSADVTFSAPGSFGVWIDNPLIDIQIVRDKKIETLDPARQQKVVAKSRARAHVSLMAIALWLTLVSVVMLFVGVGISSSDSVLGASIGIPAMLIVPIALVLVVVAGVRTLTRRHKAKRDQHGNR